MEHRFFVAFYCLFFSGTLFLLAVDALYLTDNQETLDGLAPPYDGLNDNEQPPPSLLLNLATSPNFAAAADSSNTTTSANRNVYIDYEEQLTPAPVDEEIITPQFDENLSSQNVTVNPGDTAVITCTVKNLGTYLVIWRRTDQLVPLTIGRSRHVLDERISADGKSATGEWRLMIRDARFSDSGLYRCQVNVIQDDGFYLERQVQLRVRDIPLLVIDAHEAVRSSEAYVAKLAGMTALPRPLLYDLLKHETPPMPAPRHLPMSTSYYPVNKRGRHHKSSSFTPSGDLSIGGSDYVEKGQNIELSCNATSSHLSERQPQTVEWFKDGEKLESSRESGYFITKHIVTRTLYSTLIVYKADLVHAGEYVCRVPELNAVESWRVTVLNIQPGTVKRGTGSLVDHPDRSSSAVRLFNALLSLIITTSAATVVLFHSSSSSSSFICSNLV